MTDLPPCFFCCRSLAEHRSNQLGHPWRLGEHVTADDLRLADTATRIVYAQPYAVDRWNCTSYCLCLTRKGHFEKASDDGVWVLYEDHRAEVERLRAALKGLSDMYARTWDRVDGALVMMPDRVSLFEESHRAARIALGEPNGDEMPQEPQSGEQT